MNGRGIIEGDRGPRTVWRNRLERRSGEQRAGIELVRGLLNESGVKPYDMFRAFFPFRTFSIVRFKMMRREMTMKDRV